jgi:adenine-specific DNA-methyltransferase
MIRSSTEPAGTNLEWPTGEIYSSPRSPPDIDPESIAPESPVEPGPPSIATPTDDVLAPSPKPLDKQHFDELVDRVTTAGTEITAAMGTGLAESERLRDAVAEWCTLHGLNAPDEEQTRTIVGRQAALNLLLKTTLYEWHHQHGDLSPLGDDLRGALRQAKNRTGNPAFRESVLDEVLWLVDDEVLAPVIDARHRLVDSDDPAEDIGRLYAALTPNESRRTLGQFRTPPDVGKFMQTWATSGDDVVLDPGIGAGTLTSPFHPQWVLNTGPAYVDGIDRSPLSRLMGTTALTIARQDHDLQRQDFLALTPADLPREPDAIVCNPPYTRAEALPREYKHAINAQAQRETGLDVDLASPLYTYFIYHARRFLRPGDRAAFIVPHHFLAADYGESLKRFLLDEFDIKALVLYDPDEEPIFAEALSTALILLVEAVGDGETDTDEEAADDTRLVRVDRALDTGQLRDAVHTETAVSPDWGALTRVSQEQLVPEENWRRHFDPLEIDTSALTPLSEFATVSRGVLTGENDLFCLTDEEVDKWGIPAQSRSPLIRSGRYVSGYDFRAEDWGRLQDDGTPVWLLDGLSDVTGIPDDLDDAVAASTEWSAADPGGTSSSDLSSTPVVEYLRAELLRNEAVSTRSTLQDRTQWYRVPSRDPAPILVFSLQRTGFRAILNETDARNLNNLHGIYPDDSLDDVDVKALLAYLNSGFAKKVVRRYERTYAGGATKIEPGDLKELPVLDPCEVRDEVVVELAERFDALRKTARGDGDMDEVDVIDRIDELLEQAL